MKRVLIIGASGFIGSEIYKILLKQKKIQIMVLAHNNVDYKIYEGVNLYIGSFTNINLSIIKNFNPDTIIHSARISGSTKIKRLYASIKGYFGNKRLRNYLIKNIPNVKILYVSGTLVYGNGNSKKISENSKINPISFAREYFLAEKPWLNAQKRNLLKVSIVRPPWIIGNGSWFNSFFLNTSKKYGFVPVYGNGENWMSLIDVEDCAGLIINIIKNCGTGNVYNIYTPGQYVKQIDFCKELSNILEMDVKIIKKSHPLFPKNKATIEAFQSSLMLATNYPEIFNNYSFKINNWKDMLKKYALIDGK